jgi:arylsulfatase
MRLLYTLMSIAVACVLGTPDAVIAAPRPNILFILADDMGYSDAGCYGSDIQTPNIDRLAKNGLRFTQFYNTARCWPSRAALLTGYYAQQVRRDNLPNAPGGASGVRPVWAHLLPEMLRPLGYRAYHSGKWHVDGQPLKNGFDHSYLLQDQDRYFSPKIHFEDDKKLPPVQPDSGYYATIAVAEHAIRCLKEHAEKHADQPFFHYLAFTSPHFPLQALPEDIARYREQYRAGWDALRPKRLQRMKEFGIVDCALSKRTPGVPAWDGMTADDREKYATRMAIHAAMIDRMDREIGRVLDQIKAMGKFDDTLIFFASDNGASAENLVRGDGHDPTAPPGSAKTFMCLEPGGANLANTPLRRSKIFVHEGGISTPLIVHWPKGIAARGELRHNPAHLIDIAPTVLQLAGGEWPTKWADTPVPPNPGRSLVPVFTKDGTVTHDYFFWYHSGNRAFRVGDWKVVSEGKGDWELYDLKTDRCESNDLAAKQPDKVREMAEQWTKKAEEFRRLAAGSE